MNPQMKRLYEAAGQLRHLATQSEVAREMNLSPQVLSNWERRGMSKAGMLKAQSIFGCSATWLETGEGQMVLAAQAVQDAEVSQFAANDESPFLSSSPLIRVGEEPDTIPIRRVKLKLRAGIAGYETEPEMDDGGVLHMPRNVIEKNNFIPHMLLAVTVSGCSMEPLLFEDDVVVVNTADRKPVDRELFAVNFNGEACVKQLWKNGGQWFLRSMNPDHGPVSVRSGQCDIVGRVVYQPGRELSGRL